MLIYFIVPAINIGGGLREVINLAQNMKSAGSKSIMVSLWRATHQMPTSLPIKELTFMPAQRLWAILGFWYVCARYIIFLMGLRKKSLEEEFFVFTHYLTVIFSIFVSRKRRFFFVQDLEWRFLGKGFISKLVKKVLIFCYRRGAVISANSYLTKELQRLDIAVKYDLSIWANPEFKGDRNKSIKRDFDFVMVLRTGLAKRLDLYLDFINLSLRDSDLKVVVITPHDDIAHLIENFHVQTFLRPSLEEMRKIYERSKVFVMLSEHEGFGLPPLEAMGSGCVPVCRASGGINAYMYGKCLDELVLPLSISVDEIFNFCKKIITDPLRLEKYSFAAGKCFDEGLKKAAYRQKLVQNIFLDMKLSN